MSHRASNAGLVLFGHGARDPRWALPMERIQARLIASLPNLRVELAFLELISPDLRTAAERLAAEGCNRIIIVPIFIGQGGHVRRDLAALVQSLREEHAELDIRCVAAAGEDDTVLDALAAYCRTAVQPFV